MEEDMNVFRGMSIMLLTIIAYMLLNSLYDIPLITFILCAGSGALIVYTCKDIDRKNLKTFKAIMATGIIFFLAGNYVIMTNLDKYYYDINAIYATTIGLFLSSLGMIIMFSVIPLIIYKDIQEHSQRKELKLQRA